MATPSSLRKNAAAAADQGKLITALCALIATSGDGFKIDTAKAAPILGIALPRNV